MPFAFDLLGKSVLHGALVDPDSLAVGWLRSRRALLCAGGHAEGGKQCA